MPQPDGRGISRPVADRRYLRPESAGQPVIVSARFKSPGGRISSGTSARRTTRFHCKTPVAVRAVQVLISNTYVGGSGETPSSGSIKYQVGYQRKDPTTYNDTNVLPVTWDPNLYVLRGGDLQWSNLIDFGLAEDEDFFVWLRSSSVSLGAPSAPSVSYVAGSGFLSAATYYVAVTYVYPDGTESPGSTASSVVVSAGSGRISVTSPAAANGAIAYRVYISTSSSTQYESNSGDVPIGTDFTLSYGAPSNTVAARRVDGSATYIPTGIPPSGGTVSGGIDNGDGLDSATNGTGNGFPGINSSASGTSDFSPVAVAGTPADGRPHASFAVLGDSINAGTNTSGHIGGSGGFTVIALSGQAANRVFDKTVTPLYGVMNLATGGETAATAASSNGERRAVMGGACSTMICNYGTNDLGTNAATLAANLLTIHGRFMRRGQPCWQETILPKTSSTDSWFTLANQTWASAAAEGRRRQVNLFITDSGTSGLTVVDEAPFRGAGTMGPSSDPYSGGNGSATVFYPRRLFATAGLVVKVNGVTQALTTDYTITDTATVNGVACASSITFNVAPTNGAVITCSYTSVVGLCPTLMALYGGFAGALDVCPAVEVNGAGTAATNGGFWKAPATTTPIYTGVIASLGSGGTLNVSGSPGWAALQMQGHVMRIDTDTDTPAAVGQMNGIAFNGTASIGNYNSWATNPSVAGNSTVGVYDQLLAIDGVHPTLYGHRVLATYFVDNLLPSIRAKLVELGLH